MKIVLLIILSVFLLTACPQKKNTEPADGFVTLEYTITENGSVENPIILHAKPKRIFDQEALKAILKLKFKPKTVNGKPIKYRTFRTIEFRKAENP